MSPDRSPVIGPSPLSRRAWLIRSAALAAAARWSLSHLTAAEPAPAPAVPPPAGKKLIARSEKPYNAEPAPGDLIAAGITPIEHFFVRSHGEVPNVEPRSFRVTVEGMVGRKLTLSLDELKARFMRVAAEATLTCAGNRRVEMSAVKPIAGVAWDIGAIGHARWGGALLAQVLKAAEPAAGAKHVWFEGLDPIREKDGSVAPFGGSIPLEKALADGPGPKPLLAWEMNDRPLTAAHGAPLRSLTPGFIGARSVKWLSKIVVSDRPSPNHYVAEAYKLIQTADEVASKDPIYEFAVNAVICTPGAAGKIPAGKTRIAGYALPGGQPGCHIEQVELSTDGGKTWRDAELLGAGRAYSWRLWEVTADLAPGPHQLVVRARDSLGQATPEQPVWNLKGYLYNTWHRLRVEAV